MLREGLSEKDTFQCFQAWQSGSGLGCQPACSRGSEPQKPPGNQELPPGQRTLGLFFFFFLESRASYVAVVAFLPGSQLPSRHRAAQNQSAGSKGRLALLSPRLMEAGDTQILECRTFLVGSSSLEFLPRLVCSGCTGPTALQKDTVQRSLDVSMSSSWRLKRFRLAQQL